MLWNLKYEKHKFSIEAAIEKKRELPQWFLEEPEMQPGDEFYFKAFNHLGTCRSFGMAMGPIPWRDIVYYADRFELEEDLIDGFIYIIQEMDRVYREHCEKESKEDNKE